MLVLAYKGFQASGFCLGFDQGFRASGFLFRAFGGLGFTSSFCTSEDDHDDDGLPTWGSGSSIVGGSPAFL